MTKYFTEKSFKDQLQKGTLPPFILWVGEEDYFKLALLTFIRNEAPRQGYAFEVQSAGEESTSEILGRAATPSLLGGKDILVLTELERCGASERRYLKEYIEKLPPDLIVIAVASSDLDLDDEFMRDLSRIATVMKFPRLGGNELVAWASEKTKALELVIEQRALTQLVEAYEGQVGRLSSEIEKLSLLYPQGGSLSAHDIEEALGPSVWNVTKKLVDAVRGGNLKEALQTWEEERLFGNKPESLLGSLFYEAATLPESEENLETLYLADIALKTGAAPEVLCMPLAITRIVHPLSRIKEEKPLWQK